jgi:hypothetical protein
MSDDELTKPLIGEKSIRFDDEVSVRDSLVTNGVISYHEKPYSMDGHKTESRSKNKSDDIDETRFGISTTAKPLDPKVLQNIKKEKQELKKKDEFRARYGDEAFKIEYGEDEFTRIYGSECDDGQSCCGGKKCRILGGKKTKRRKYTKKRSKRNRSRKSRKNKKSSKNNKK